MILAAVALALLAADPAPPPAPAPPPPAPAPPPPAPAPAPAPKKAAHKRAPRAKAPRKDAKKGEAAKAGEKAPAKELHTPAKGHLVLGKETVGKRSTFVVSVGDCRVPKGAPKGTPAECAVQVQLKSRKQKLPWTSPAGAVYQQGDANFAIGDDADTALAVSWKPLSIAKGVDGIMVTEQSGGERVKQRHDVFLDVRGRLDYALSAGPQRGEDTWSTVSTLDVDGNGSQEIILVHASRPDAETEADEWDMSVWGWRADVRKIVKLPSWTPTIHAAMVGEFNSVAAARELAKEKCLREFIVVDSKSAPLLEENMFAVVYPAATERDAELALEAATACDDDIVGAVKIISRGMDVKAE